MAFRRVVVAVLAVSLTVAACGRAPRVAQPGHVSALVTASTSGGSAAPTGGPVSVAPMAGCSDDPAPTNVVQPDGSALSLTINQQNSGYGWNIALPVSAVAKYPQLEVPTGNPQIITQANDAGDGFWYGGERLTFTVENLTGKPVLIDDVRPVDTRAVCEPNGLLVLYPSQGGGDYVRLHADLDAARPAAYDVPLSGASPTSPYFATHGIPVAPHQQQGVSLMLNAVTRAHTFDIDVDYVIGGRKADQILRGKNGPFKVTEAACPDAKTRATLGAADLQRLRQYHFQNIFELNIDSGQFVLRRIDQKTLDAECPTM